MDAKYMVKYIILLTPVNKYLLSLVGSAVGSVVKKTLIYTARNAYNTIVNK